ncbi:MAG: peptide chain release factor-like protein [Phycisphaeraceae bacterium]|nr:peptide chain release factor-like protein [Phycisphaeraceae bacterium]MCW5764095.1 peptide chain release factor-like protein [Phycisphaeraceae bacterium]
MIDFDAPVQRPVHPASLPIEELLRACSITTRRSGGPGGQRRNKVETAIELLHTPTGIAAAASERRSVNENRPVAVRRLRLALATEIRMAVPSGEIRSDLWRARCRNGRIVCNPLHWDYPSLLAEALDVLEACGYDSAKAAIRLECTTSQLHKLIQNQPPAWAKLNQERVRHGMHSLK